MHERDTTMTNYLFGIAASGWIGTTINTIQYYTRPRLIIISQAIWYKGIPKFISSGWDVFKSLGVAHKHKHDMTIWRQI